MKPLNIGTIVGPATSDLYKPVTCDVRLKVLVGTLCLGNDNQNGCHFDVIGDGFGSKIDEDSSFTQNGLKNPHCCKILSSHAIAHMI